jgi:hypothetical protein
MDISKCSLSTEEGDSIVNGPQITRAVLQTSFPSFFCPLFDLRLAQTSSFFPFAILLMCRKMKRSSLTVGLLQIERKNRKSVFTILFFPPFAISFKKVS